MVALPLALALVHIALVWPRYHVGSFDDDANYILAARGLLHGSGLTGLIGGGRPLVGYYPPGFPALLAPLVWLFGHQTVALRLLSTVAVAALFPLTWWYLGRHRMGDWARVAVLVLLALDPVLATYGSMVMAEAPFLVLLIAWLAVAERWDRAPAGKAGALSRYWPAAATVVAGAGLVWLKQAGLGLVVGLVTWHLWRRRPWRAALTAAGTALLLAPVLVARAGAGIPMAGARYSSELGTFYQGGAVHRLLHTLPSGLAHLLVAAFPQSIIPSGVSPLPASGPVAAVLSAWGWSVPVFCAVGAAQWWRRGKGGLAAVSVAVYLLEVAAYPFVNQRRVILVLPVVAAWYVVGAGWVLRGGLALVRRRVTLSRPAARGGAAVAAALLVVVPQVAQIRRDYLFPGTLSSSAPRGSPYMALLARLGRPSDVVESDYLSTTALYSGHLTQSTAFSRTNSFMGQEVSCVPSDELAALEADRAAFLLTAAVNSPDHIDSQCLLSVASSSPSAVRLLRTGVDDASVFELVGPGTVHPHLTDVLPGASLVSEGPVVSTPLPRQGPVKATRPRSDPGASVVGGVVVPPPPPERPSLGLRAPTRGGRATFTWSWPAPVDITQLSVGQAGATTTSGVEVDELRPGAGWVVVSAVRGAVGDPPDANAGAGGAAGAGLGAGFVLSTTPGRGVAASAVRVIVEGGGTAQVSDVVALGPGPAPAAVRPAGP
ncbi:MAG: phospholipid carrier-dependent glycosyltransferase [Acidimicrobiales bacterium]